VKALFIFCMVCLLGCSSSSPRGGSDDKIPSETSHAKPQSVPQDTGGGVGLSSSESGLGEATITSFTKSQASELQERENGDPIPARELLPPTTSLEMRQEAIALAETLVQGFPDNPDALEIKARFLMLFGEVRGAKSCWMEAVRLVPDYAYALHGLGKIAMLDSEYDKAIDYLSRSIPKQPGVAEPVHDLADAYTKLGRLDDALKTLKAFAEANAHSALTWLLLGQAAQTKQDFVQAEQAYRKALELSPGTSRAEQGLATVLMRLGKREEAKQRLEALRASQPSATNNRSPDQVFQDERKECSTRFHSVADFYASSGDLATATRVARRALALDPKNLKAKSTLSKLHLQNGRLPEAIALLKELRTDEPTNASWPFTLGVILVQNGDSKAAAEQYREVIRLAPQNPVGYEALTQLVLGQGNEVKQVIDIAEQLVKLRGTAADHELLAQVYAITEDYRQAEKSLKEAIRRDPANPNYLQAMKQLQKVLGTKNE
jgi:tetratricopeptide (TPR) repeat protein